MENFGYANESVRIPRNLPEPHDIPRPDFIKNLSAPIAEFSGVVMDTWLSLTREYVPRDPITCAGCVDSYLKMRHPFIVAGGRFREPYYWDSFWIIEGLLRSGSYYHHIARGMIENFLDAIQLYGFVPNGMRKYYLNRSQPPMLTQMIRIYIEHTNDTSILKRALPLLDNEYEWWMKNRAVSIRRNITLNRYHVVSKQPRPESYKQDWRTAMSSTWMWPSDFRTNQTRPLYFSIYKKLNIAQILKLFGELAAAAESGVDYTARWLSQPARVAGPDAPHANWPLRTLDTSSLVPVELNSILWWNEDTLSRWHTTYNGSFSKTARYKRAAARRRDAIHTLLWNDTHSSYHDWNLTSQSQKVMIPVSPTKLDQLYSPALLAPFWTGAAHDSLRLNASAVRRAFTRTAKLLHEVGGSIPASNIQSGEQ